MSDSESGQSEKEKEVDKIAEAGDELRQANKNKQIPFDFGLCGTCDKFYYIEFEGYGNFKAWCNISYDIPIKRTPAERVKICSRYWNRKYKSVRELADFATWIDGKKQIGFERG